MTDLSSKSKANLIAEAALDKKADRVVILEMKDLFPISDYFVIASAESTRKVKAISESVQEKLGKFKIRHWHIEGMDEAQWVLLDYNDVIVHVFLTEVRDFYNLERLWGDAPRTAPSDPLSKDLKKGPLAAEL